MTETPTKRRPRGADVPYYSVAHERYEVTITLSDGKQKTITSSKIGTQKQKWKEINAKLTEAKRQIEVGVDAAKGNQTVQKYMQEEWIPAYQLEVRDSTYEKRRQFLDNMITEFGGYKLKDLRPEHLQNWVMTKLAKRLAPSSLKLCYGLFKRILADAVGRGYLIASPCRGIKLPKVEEEEMNILDSQQRKIFRDHLSATGNRYESLFVVALTTAMRISEIRATKWKDIDFEKDKWGEISVCNNLVYLERVGYIKHKPKTRAGTRDIPLTELARKKLTAHRIVQKEQYLKTGVPWDEEVLVWQQDKIGEPFADSTIRRILNKALQECGIPRIRIHDLRHTAITWWLTSRMQLITAKKLAGHSRIEQTLKYAHALPETIQADMALFNAAVG